MISRRELFAGGALFSQRSSGGDDTAAINGIRDAILSLRATPGWATVNLIREKQRVFLKSTHRFPDRVDVGIRVWERLQDWHVENQREMRIGRSADGRLEMELLMTAVVLRPELPENEIGIPYDRQ